VGQKGQARANRQFCINKLTFIIISGIWTEATGVRGIWRKGTRKKGALVTKTSQQHGSLKELQNKQGSRKGKVVGDSGCKQKTLDPLRGENREIRKLDVSRTTIASKSLLRPFLDFYSPFCPPSFLREFLGTSASPAFFLFPLSPLSRALSLTT